MATPLSTTDRFTGSAVSKTGALVEWLIRPPSVIERAAIRRNVTARGASPVSTGELRRLMREIIDQAMVGENRKRGLDALKALDDLEALERDAAGLIGPGKEADANARALIIAIARVNDFEYVVRRHSALYAEKNAAFDYWHEINAIETLRIAVRELTIDRAGAKERHVAGADGLTDAALDAVPPDVLPRLIEAACGVATATVATEKK